MSGGEPLWRRVAGLYLSGIPADAKDRVSTRAPVNGGSTKEPAEDPTTEIIMLGEALDLVTLAQGYRSPAVPLLLRALIRVARQVAAERAEAAAAAAAAESEAESPTEGAGDEQPADTGKANGNGAEPSSAEAASTSEILAETSLETPSETSGETAEAVEPEADAVPAAEASAALERRMTQTDRKVAALTAAVGQLVDVLQRRARNGGDIERRAAPRLPGTHATVFVHGQPYEVVNWSQGGFLIRIAEADRFSRGGFDFHFVLELPDETVEFQGRARPVRIERTTLAAEFATLDETTAARIGEITASLAGSD